MTQPKIYFSTLAISVVAFAQAQTAPNSTIGAGFTSAKAKADVAQAVRIGGEDMKAEVAKICIKPPPAQVYGLPPKAGVPFVPRPLPPPEVGFEPTAVFDNVFYFGSLSVGATAIKTSEGIILIDTLTTSEAVETILIPGMKKFGLDPAQIKFVILTHSHGDHHGGVKYLREHYPTLRVVMSAADWAFSEQPFYMGDGKLDSAPKPPRAKNDIAYKGSYTVKLGQTSVKLFETPGHTPGTTSLLYPVTSGGRTYTVVQWGGGAPMNANFSLATVEGFINAAKAAKSDIWWSSHSTPDHREKMAQIRLMPAAPNPIIEDQGKLARYLDIILACKRAAADDEISNVVKP